MSEDTKQQIQYVPVLDKNNVPLMPCHPARARQLLRKGKAVRRWFRGVFAIKLTDRIGGATQPIAVGVDPGSKREGFTVKSESRTLLNIQAHAIYWVKLSIENRRSARKARRSRKTPYRKCRWNRSNLRKSGYVSPSTKARWGFKLRILKYLQKLYPITDIIIEDIKAPTKAGKMFWNKNFSPIQHGKNWFYEECSKLTNIHLIEGKETSDLRKTLGVIKNKSDKLKSEFNVHCVDSWVMTYKIVGGSSVPELTKVLEIIPIRLHRRELHRRNFQKGGIRPPYGGTRSLGFTRGSIVKHPKYGLSYVGGCPLDRSTIPKRRLTLHDFASGKRITVLAKVEDVEFLSYNSWRWNFPS